MYSNLAMEGKVPMPQLRMTRLCPTMMPDRTRKNHHVASLSRRLPSIGRKGRLAALVIGECLEGGASVSGGVSIADH